jgi:hypothetical protein
LVADQIIPGRLTISPASANATLVIASVADPRSQKTCPADDQLSLVGWGKREGDERDNPQGLTGLGDFLF